MLSRIRIPKMPKNFKHRDFSEYPIFWGRNEKKINMSNFPKQAKIFKIPQKISKHLRKKNLMNISEHRICWIPKFLSKSEKFSTNKICLKYIRQNKDSQTNQYFSSILRNVFQDSLECPILNPKKNIFKNLIVSFIDIYIYIYIYIYIILNQNNKKILTWGISARPKLRRF